jgi:hypothetical protein
MGRKKVNNDLRDHDKGEKICFEGEEWDMVLG